MAAATAAASILAADSLGSPGSNESGGAALEAATGGAVTAAATAAAPVLTPGALSSSGGSGESGEIALELPGIGIRTNPVLPRSGASNHRALGMVFSEQAVVSWIEKKTKIAVAVAAPMLDASLPLSLREQPRSDPWLGSMFTMNSLRGVVSKKKRRFKEGGFDLDLTYVTPRLIGMGFPSVEFEATSHVGALETPEWDSLQWRSLPGSERYN